MICSIINSMTDKEKLNSILRLRLFYSTEKELSDLVGYNLKGNHFSRFKDFQCDAYFSKFAEECQEYTQGKVNLAWLLYQYEATSKFFKKYIEKTRHEANKRFIPYLLNYIYNSKTLDDGVQHSKDIILCERYDTYNTEGEMNVGILILMTYGLIPTFKNKTNQDISDIIGDFQKAYDILSEIAKANQTGASTIYKEMLCLKEMRKLIKEERAGDKFINRLLLIHITNDVVNRVFALKKPAKLRQYSKEIVPMDFELTRLWRCEDEPDNIVWEFVPLNIDAYYLYRNEIDYQAKKIKYTKYQLIFKNIGYKDFCYTVIMRPAFNWHNILKREQSDDSISFDYTDIEYEDDKRIVKKLTFTQESPLSEKPMDLKPVNKKDVLVYYTTHLDHEGVAHDFEDEDCQSQYEVRMDTMEVAVSDTAILFKGDDCIYKLNKFDEEGNETIEGISSLSHTDNFIYAELDDEGTEHQFLCLDSINQNIDIETLLNQPYFRKITNINDIF